jgi:hypothetical protein
MMIIYWFFFFFFEMRTYCTAHADLELTILLSSLSKCWDYSMHQHVWLLFFFYTMSMSELTHFQCRKGASMHRAVVTL